MTAERGGFAALDSCVHCGFCLQACPTFLATGDEADGPRGRIELMRGLERGTLTADDPTVTTHLDRCLGCRGCEPVCPSGVGYGHGLEAARERLTATRGVPPLVRATLALLTSAGPGRVTYALARALRATGMPGLLAGWSRTRFAMGMLAATNGGRRKHAVVGTRQERARTDAREGTRTAAGANGSVALFRGCVMDTLFAHVHAATRRTLEANGYEVRDVAGQGCCGALHEHAGDRDSAAALAARNVAALLDSADYIVVNSAGCGALLKDYGHLLGTDAAREFGAKVRDVSELLAEQGPRPGVPLGLEVAYDAPCHLQHAQRVHAAPLALLRAVPELDVRLLPGSDRCCGSAGIFSLLQPEMARAVLADKVSTLGSARPALDLVVTGNPGCLMQIGAGLRAAGFDISVAHPVEVLDWSYDNAGIYDKSVNGKR